MSGFIPKRLDHLKYLYINAGTYKIVYNGFYLPAMFTILLVICSNLLLYKKLFIALSFEIIIIILLNDFLLTSENTAISDNNNKNTNLTIKRRKAKRAEELINNPINRAPELPTSWVAWFVGLLDGDGYLGLTKSNNSIKWELNIRLSSVDLPLLLHIRDT